MVGVSVAKIHGNVQARTLISGYAASKAATTPPPYTPWHPLLPCGVDWRNCGCGGSQNDTNQHKMCKKCIFGETCRAPEPAGNGRAYRPPCWKVAQGRPKHTPWPAPLRGGRLCGHGGRHTPPTSLNSRIFGWCFSCENTRK